MKTFLALIAVPALSHAGPTSVERLKAFTYADVHLTGGPLAAQADGAKSFYLALNEDSLLQGFRQRAGLPAPGKPMGGWYDPQGFAAAHPFGQYISALARTYASTGDPRYKAKVARLVHGLHQTLGKDGFFYASDKVYREWPCYIYDKYCIAMRDAYRFTGNREALIVLGRMTDWAFTHLPRRSDEWYTLPENLYNCYGLTGDPRYLVMAGEFDASREYLDEFAQGKNAFHPDLHAYSHVNALSSSAKAYEVTGSVRYLRATENAWDLLTSTQMYASGGWGPDEHFVVPGTLGKMLNATGAHFETPCGTYANVNLDRYLLRFTGDPKYGDNMERVLLNGLLGALPPKPDGRTFYYSDYRPGTQKGFFGDAWPCCSGTYAEASADYPLDIYFHDAEGVFVNLFAPSKLSWTVRGHKIGLAQSTRFPEIGATHFRIAAQGPTRFSLNVRVPAWTSGQPSVRINGKPLKADSRPGTFLRITRSWSNGDTVDVTFPESLRFEPIDSNTRNRVALMYGPLMLVALAPGDVALSGDPTHPERWISKAPGQNLDFLAKGGTVFRPFYQISAEHYTTYCLVKKTE